MSRHLPLVLVCGLLLLIGGAPAKEHPAPTPKGKRTVYLVKHGSAKDLAEALGQHFKGEAEIQVVPEPNGNALLISATPAVFEDLVKVLGQLDRPPATIFIEVVIADVSRGEKGEVDGQTLSGPIEEVEGRIQALEKEGRVNYLRRVALATLENQQASVLIGENKPLVMGSSTTRNGLVSNSITYRNTGTQVLVTPRLGADHQVLMRIEAEDSRLARAEGVRLGTDGKGEDIPAVEVTQSNLKTTLAVPSGRAVAVEGVQTSTKSRNTQIVVVVAARVGEPHADAGKSEHP